MEYNNKTIFIDKLKSFISNRELIKLVISNQRDHASDLKNIIVTIVTIKKEERLNFVYRYKTKDITKNFDTDEAIGLIRKSLETEFFNGDLFASTETIQLALSSRGKVRMKSTQPVLKMPETFSHDRVKERIIEPHQSIYLRELGILNAGFEVRSEMNDKYLQINRYIELLSPFFSELKLPYGFHVADMGSGKGYLTFALYDYLTRIGGQKVFMTGVESRDELVISSNRIAAKAAFKNLNFITGTIREVNLEKIDILIALHACDTATDDAIFRGITAGASLIVCAPCCHKQVRKEFHVATAMKAITKHGILEERQAEIVTDGIRALLLEAHGYKTSVFEFISPDHTPKNVMIVGRKIRGQNKNRESRLESIRAIKEEFGIGKHYLEGLLEGAWVVSGEW